MAHATAIDIFCWMDGGSLLWATSYELGFVVYRAYLFNNISVALGVLAVIIAMWRVPLEAGFAIGLLAIVSIHYRCLDVPPWVLWTPELDQIRSHSVSAVYWILSATAFWLFDKLTHKWQVFGHAWWHGICACGVGHLISAAALARGAWIAHVFVYFKSRLSTARGCNAHFFSDFSAVTGCQSSVMPVRLLCALEPVWHKAPLNDLFRMWTWMKKLHDGFHSDRRSSTFLISRASPDSTKRATARGSGSWKAIVQIAAQRFRVLVNARETRPFQ